MDHSPSLLSRYGLTTLLLALLVLFQAQLWMGRGSLPEVWKMQQQLTDLHASKQEATRTNERLKAEVQDLVNGLDMVEERARAELGMVKPNEILVQYQNR
jgi:cell division protein FtsB